jgi:hypothetical protein
MLRSVELIAIDPRVGGGEACVGIGGTRSTQRRSTSGPAAGSGAMTARSSLIRSLVRATVGFSSLRMTRSPQAGSA